MGEDGNKEVRAMPLEAARSGELRSEPVPVSALRAPATIADVLSRAADLIVECGWTQGEWENNGCFCLDGALMHVKGDTYTFPELDLVCQATGAESAIWWNDAPERTQAEVVAKLREAAALATLARGAS